MTEAQFRVLDYLDGQSRPVSIQDVGWFCFDVPSWRGSPARTRAAAGVIGHLRRAGLVAWFDGWELTSAGGHALADEEKRRG